MEKTKAQKIRENSLKTLKEIGEGENSLFSDTFCGKIEKPEPMTETERIDGLRNLLLSYLN